MRTEHVLEVSTLTKNLGTRAILEDVCLHVDVGEVVGLLGRNGSGKSTLLQTVMGSLPSDTGDIRLGGELINYLSMSDRACKGMGLLTEGMAELGGMTVVDGLVSELEKMPPASTDSRQYLMEVLAAYGLSMQKEQRVDTLSPGQSRRFGICRSMLARPHLLMMDEPFSGVGPQEQTEVKTVIRGLPSHGTSVLIADHNAKQALEVCNRAYVLVTGKIITEGSASDLLKIGSYR